MAWLLPTLPFPPAVPLDPCENNPCLHGGTCRANGTMYGCSCDQGFAGENCEIGEYRGIRMSQQMSPWRIRGSQEAGFQCSLPLPHSLGPVNQPHHQTSELSFWGLKLWGAASHYYQAEVGEGKTKGW